MKALSVKQENPYRLQCMSRGKRVLVRGWYSDLLNTASTALNLHPFPPSQWEAAQNPISGVGDDPTIPRPAAAQLGKRLRPEH